MSVSGYNISQPVKPSISPSIKPPAPYSFGNNPPSQLKLPPKPAQPPPRSPFQSRPPFQPQQLNRPPQGRPPQGKQPLGRPPEKKKTNWVKIIIGVIVIAAIVIAVILIFTLSGGSSGGGGGGGGGGGSNGGALNPNSPNVPTPPDNAPNQDVKGSGGVCTLDTDCPLIVQLIDGKLVSNSQYCVSGICVTNKVCTTNTDCQSVPDIPELSSCKLGGTGTASKCRYTAGCSNGFCARLGCKTSTDCGLNEACSVNDALGEKIGVCLPIGNTCTNSTTGNSAQCWAGLFGCTAFSGVSQGTVSTGYCTQCYAGGINICNMGDNPQSGPGSYCDTVTGFSGTLNGNIGAPPAVCKTNDNFKYTDCPSGTVAGSTFNGNVVCCKSASSNNTCGQKCLDDYQCGDNCPYCVPFNGDNENRVCSCIRISPTQDGHNGAQSTYACNGGYGFTYDYNTGSQTDNQINPNFHVCVKSETAECAFNYDAYDYGLIGARGNIVCSTLSKPYCTLDNGKCSDTLEGSVCITQTDGSTPCIEIDSSGNLSISTEYACTMNKLCTKRNYLIAGENCIKHQGQGLSCGEGLICSLPMGPSGKQICIPDGFGQ